MGRREGSPGKADAPDPKIEGDEQFSHPQFIDHLARLEIRRSDCTAPMQGYWAQWQRDRDPGTAALAKVWHNIDQAHDEPADPGERFADRYRARRRTEGGTP